jgi:hypothetical protein
MCCAGGWACAASTCSAPPSGTGSTSTPATWTSFAELVGGAGFDYFGTYFALKEGLEQILGRPVDVVTATSIRNPYFRDQVMRTRELLYAPVMTVTMIAAVAIASSRSGRS